MRGSRLGKQQKKAKRVSSDKEMLAVELEITHVPCVAKFSLLGLDINLVVVASAVDLSRFFRQGKHVFDVRSSQRSTPEHS